MRTSPWAGSVPAVPVPPAANPWRGGERLAFAAEPGRFFRLVARGAALTLLTLGFYRFWLTTDVRRHLWARTRLGEESPVYTGTPRELLIGFLVAVAVLIPFQVLGFGATLGLGRGGAGGLGFLFLALFGQFALYRARRYRLTRTVFRGVRFGADGSGWAYAGLALPWTVLSVVTLGLAYPWQAAALERYKLRHTHYGTLPGAFAGTGWGLAKGLVGPWLAVAAGLGGTLTLLAAARGLLVAIEVAVWSVVLLVVVLALAYPVFRAVTTRWWLDGVRLGGASVRSELGAFAFLGPYMLYALVLALLAGGGVAVLAGAAYVAGAGSAARLAPGMQAAAFAGVTLGYVALALVALALKRRIVDYTIWGRTVASLTLVNPAALERAQALPERANALGEGLADALGTGGI